MSCMCQALGNVLYIHCQLIFIITLQNWWYYLHFMDEKTEVSRCKVTWYIAYT